MSLLDYEKLQAESEEHPALLGCKLPQLNAGKLEIDTNTQSTTDIVKLISNFEAKQGWVMYRDSLEIATGIADGRTDFIEGEWSKGEHSLKVKLLANDRYMSIEFSPCQIGKQADNQDEAYSDQIVFVTNQLKGKLSEGTNAACYRLWWKQENDGEHQGRWVPLAQQFMGFCYTKENK